MGSDVEGERAACAKSAEPGCCDGNVDAARVSGVQGRLPTIRVTEGMAALFKVLADPSRCRLIAAIIEAGEMCVCDLSATIGISESNTSHHLRVLRSHGLVRARRVGRTVYYSPDDAHIRLLLDTTREHIVHRGGEL